MYYLRVNYILYFSTVLKNKQLTTIKTVMKVELPH